MNNEILDHAQAIGELLVAEHGKVFILGGECGPGAIPETAVDAVAQDLTSIIAEILQAWLDAGSEREVTDEELYQPIHDHVFGWTHPAESTRGT